MGDLELKLLPPQAKGHTSAARVADDWYVACRSDELKPGRKRAVRVLGVPIALYRGEDGAPGALLDRCPHRNVPLTTGRVVGADLECGYHGWRFDRAGECTRIPGLCGEASHRGRRVESFATTEGDGFVWVYATPDVEPARQPYVFPHLGEDGWHSVYDVVEADATLHAVAENALDVPHTAFLHGGLFRNDSAERQTIEVIVRRWHDRIEAQYVGEARPEGIVGRILAPQGGEVEHFDRFILPGITEVEYKLSDRSHIVVSSALTPVDDFHTKLYTVVSFKLPLPAWLVSLVVKPIARRIFGQDKSMLALQRETIERFGGERFVSTELDALGPGILRLLRNAERGQRTPMDEPEVKRFTMQV